MMSNIKCKTAITAFSIIALVSSVIGHLSCFFNYEYEYVRGVSRYTLVFKLPDTLTFLLFLLNIAPFILLVIYITKFCEQRKVTVLFPIICGLIALYPLSLIFRYKHYIGFLPLHFAFTIILFFLPNFLAFTLLAINALKGLNKKAYTIIAFSVGCIYQFLSLDSFFTSLSWYIEQELYLYLFTVPMSNIASFSLYFALFLFGVTNRIPALISVNSRKQMTENLTPEQCLRLLNERFITGEITEEEYRAQRAEIISKL